LPYLWDGRSENHAISLQNVFAIKPVGWLGPPDSAEYGSRDNQGGNRPFGPGRAAPLRQNSCDSTCGVLSEESAILGGNGFKSYDRPGLSPAFNDRFNQVLAPSFQV
jgi:hypothetical protein